MPKLIAKKSLSYAARRRAVGDVFDVPYGHARVLVAVGRAGWYVEPPAPAPAPVVPAAPIIEPPAAAATPAEKPAKAYRTRRLKAEG